jgi:hypothetical protein
MIELLLQFRGYYTSYNVDWKLLNISKTVYILFKYFLKGFVGKEQEKVGELESLRV